MLDRLGAQFVVPGLVAIDLAQFVCGAVCGQPRRGIGTEVDRVAGHVRRRVCGGDPSGGSLRRAVLRDRRCAQRPAQIGCEVGYAGILVSEHCDAIWEVTIIRDSSAAVVAAEDVTDQANR